MNTFTALQFMFCPGRTKRAHRVFKKQKKFQPEKQKCYCCLLLILYVLPIVYFVAAGSQLYLITRASLSDIAGGKWRGKGHSGLINVPSTMMRCIESGVGGRSLQTGALKMNETVGEPDVVTEEKSEPATASQSTGFAEFPNKDINRRIAFASTVFAVGLFVTTRLEFGVSLKDLTAYAIPYEKALSNGMPTVVEFYADWCEVCRELAPDVYKIEQQYKDRVNFVMLNVDNTKWEQELDEFGVEGIPHFAFLDKDGNEEGNVVGRLPRQYLLENIAALANGAPSIPHARVVGQYSSTEARKVHQVADPRSHG